MIQGIHHMSFTVSDMERSITFYRDILGLDLKWDSEAVGITFKGEAADKVTNCPGTELRIAFFVTGNSRIELVEYKPGGKPQEDNRASDTGSAHICFKTENIEELYQKLLENKVRLHCAPQKLDATKVMYFRDPDGIILEAAQGEFPV